jgi:hypothetical protein
LEPVVVHFRELTSASVVRFSTPLTVGVAALKRRSDPQVMALFDIRRGAAILPESEAKPTLGDIVDLALLIEIGKSSAQRWSHRDTVGRKSSLRGLHEEDFCGAHCRAA